MSYAPRVQTGLTSSSAREPEVEQLPDRSWGLGRADDRQRAARVVIKAGAADDGEVVELAKANGAGRDELSLRKVDRSYAHPRDSGGERAEEPRRADRLRGDPPVVQPVVDDLLVAGATSGGADIDTRIAVLTVGDPDRPGAGACVGARLQGAIRPERRERYCDGEEA